MDPGHSAGVRNIPTGPMLTKANPAGLNQEDTQT